MILNIYTVFDSKANAHIAPFFMHNDEVAIRAFTQMVSDENHQFGKNPEDYYLKNIGSFDDVDGQVDAEEPITIMSALAIAAQLKEKTS